MKRRISQKGKTLRAYRAYLELLDAAEWVRGKLRGQLESFGLTMQGFRVLELLYREGPVYMLQGAETLMWSAQRMDSIVARLEQRGWVQRDDAVLPTRVTRETQIPTERRQRERKGVRVALLKLTPEGERFIGTVFPKHAKVVKSFMRVLDSREQFALANICKKLREGDPVKFYREMIMQEIWEDDAK